MSEKDQNFIDAGDLRPNDLLTYSGPGSIVNTRYDAIMIYGCHRWPQDETRKRYKILNHPLLQKKLKLDHIRMPLSHERAFNIPCFSFPTWSVCENCNRLQQHDETPSNLNFEGYVCKYCPGNKVDPKKCKVIHARFAVVCDKGHIDEFPWDKWVHSKKPNHECEKKSDEPWLVFEAGQDSSALKDYRITCKKCYASRNCSGATEPSPFEALDITCSGRSPWLNEDTEPCFTNGKETVVKGMQIRAPSMWYSTKMSALKVPKWLHPVDIKLDDPNNDGQLKATISQLHIQNGQSFAKIIDILPTDFKEISDQILDQFNPNWSEEQVRDDIIKKLEERFDEKDDDDEIPDQIDILQQEYDDLSKTENTSGRIYENEFQLTTSKIDERYSLLNKYFDSLKQIHKISTVSVLTGFTRIKPPDVFEMEKDRICQITDPIHHEIHRWYPGVIDKGEGIFFSLDKERLSKWETNNDLKNRSKAIIESYARHAAPGEDSKAEKTRKEIINRFNPRFLLLHTLSHLLMKALAKYAGYAEPSLQERIYWDNEDINGILIYTSGSSEGSLGGLVRLGKSEHFEKRLDEAIKRSLSCSRDPVCDDSNPITDSENIPSRAHQLSGSSCHACCIVAETSCQFYNQFLDRWTIKDENAGFFKDYLNEQSY